jgi:hypothetical protein
MCGAADRVNALAHVYAHSLPEPGNGDEYSRAELEGYRPFAIVGVVSYEGRRVSRGSGSGFSGTGEIGCLIERATPAGLIATPGDAMRDWENVVGAIISDIFGLAGTAPSEDSRYLDVRDVRLVDPPWTNERKAAKIEGYKQRVLLAFPWGLE